MPPGPCHEGRAASGGAAGTHPGRWASTSPKASTKRFFLMGLVLLRYTGSRKSVYVSRSPDTARNVNRLLFPTHSGGAHTRKGALSPEANLLREPASVSR